MRGDVEIRDPADRLDALWEATRPVEPSAQAWDRVWASVADDLDRLPASTAQVVAATGREGLFVHPPSPILARRPLAVGAAAAAVVLAQAAAILLAVGLSWYGADREPAAPSQPQVATGEVRIEEGQFVLIRSNADTVQAIDLSAQLGTGGVDAWYLVYNLLESMTNPLAMSE
ncbi:hypothetical protein [Paludisphaera borealis]|uniref:Uncharacterized protein n=1 Tax=Paludisphaera borealis TaxID=1387353 RepID=A0A1U7CR80_9BACT|nr:hypothetical protein [Paludisphaera borealis]APW61450.1 hypothetical protein BSF38_02964 [Paludisphaera borealis]